MNPIFLMLALLHPVHETVAEVEWNKRTNRLEVALRLDLLDEEWIRKQAAETKNKPIQEWGIGYLRKRFRIADAPESGEPDPVEYHWIGRDQQGAHAWWYFELQPKDAKRPQTIEQRILFDRDENYRNRILLLDQVPRRSLTLSPEHPKANLDDAKLAPESKQLGTSRPPASRSDLDRR